METKSINYIPELWGGIECSLNRVGKSFSDQLQYSDHYGRGERDIELFASLGIRAIRYPVIWERHQPERKMSIDWSWTSNQLQKLRQANIEPIVGLMHHGNGPAFTHLLDPSFPSLFSDYAARVAANFPWVNLYTPINEPLTTARFSGLYGVWYPHKRSGKMFAEIFFNQMKATVMAMHSIRKINPEAKLVQTEDLAKTYSTSELKYQADFENHRRWLTWDLLCGKLDNNHPLWDYFTWLKIPEHTLNYFSEHPCAPDVIGADHYLTSERFLDQHLELYPSHYHGGNSRHRYADVEAIRVQHNADYGIAHLLVECWERYQIPIAITEVHLNGCEEDRVRWFKEVWDAARKARVRGIDVIAVTSWALLGSFGWNSLLTEKPGQYEAGAFDLSGGQPDETALSQFLRALSKNPDSSHPCIADQPWWHAADRCHYDAQDRCAPQLDRVVPAAVSA